MLSIPLLQIDGGIRFPVLRTCLALFLAGTALLPAAVTAQKERDKEEWIQLFNGRNLEGWIPKIRGHKAGVNFANTFRVEDELIKVRYDEEAYPQFDEKFGHLFHEGTYSNYLLRVEYRFVGKQVTGGPGWAFRNSGLMLHGQPPATMTLDQDFPASIEVQLLGGDGTNPRTTANLCTPGTHVEMQGQLITRHCTNSTSETYHGDQWVTVVIEVRGNEVIRHKIEGETVLEYTRPQIDPGYFQADMLKERNGGLMLHGGTISLQSESHPVDFRKVELLPLD